MNPKKTEQSLLSSGIIGAIAGGTEAICTNPLVTIKSCAQSKIPIPWCSWFPRHANLTTLLHGTKNAMRFLYRGTPVRAMGIGLSVGIRFWVRDVNVRFLFKETRLNYRQEIFNAVSAGLLSSFIITPMELTMALQQTANPNIKSDSLNKIFSQMYTQWGMKKSLTGFWSIALRDSMISSGFLTFAPAAKRYLCKHYAVNEHSAALLSGTVIGTGLSILTHPIDTVKTNQQVNLKKSASGNEQSITSVLKQVTQKEGLRGLYRGLFFRASRVGPHVGIVTAITEGLTDYWHKKEKTFKL